jgi:ribosomal-protein-serine acetyltransferase
VTRLTDGTVLLRAYTTDDAEALYEAARESIREVYPWLPWCRPSYSFGESCTWIAIQEEVWSSGSAYNFGVFDASTGAYLGGCGLNAINGEHGFANLGYWVRTSRAGRGIAVAATRLLAGFGFEALELKRVEIVVAVANHRSQRVAEKVGAAREGTLRNRLLLHGEPHDAVMYSLVP